MSIQKQNSQLQFAHQFGKRKTTAEVQVAKLIKEKQAALKNVTRDTPPNY